MREPESSSLDFERFFSRFSFLCEDSRSVSAERGLDTSTVKLLSRPFDCAASLLLSIIARTNCCERTRDWGVAGELGADLELLIGVEICELESGDETWLCERLVESSSGTLAKASEWLPPADTCNTATPAALKCGLLTGFGIKSPSLHGVKLMGV